MSYKEKVEQCRNAVATIKSRVDKYVNDWNTFNSTRTAYENQKKTAQQEYNDATQLLINVPKVKISQGQYNWAWDRVDCNTACMNIKNTGYMIDSSRTPIEVDSLPSERIFISKPNLPYKTPCIPLDWRCYPEKSDCICSIVDNSQWTTRKENEKIKYDNFIYRTLILNEYVKNNKPIPPSSFSYTCCLNKNDCVEGTNCFGIIQGCEQGLASALVEMSEKDRELLDASYFKITNDILEYSSRLIGTFNEIINLLDNNFNNLNIIKNDTNNSDVTTNYNKIINIYTNSNSLYIDLTNKLSELTTKKNQAYTNTISIFPTSIYKNSINSTYSLIILDYDSIVSKYSYATSKYISIKIDYDTILVENKIFEEIKVIINEINILKNNIDNEFSKITSINTIVEQKKKSINEEDIKIIEDLSKNVNNIDNVINDYIKTIKNNIVKLKLLKNRFRSKSIFYISINNLISSVINTETLISQDYIKFKKIIDEINNISNNLNSDLSNYKNILNSLKQVNDIISNINIDNDYKIINNLFNSAKDFTINNEDDMLNLEKIKNNASNINKKKNVELFDNLKIETFNLNNDSILSENIKLINNLNDLSNKSFNKISDNSIFYIKASEINKDTNNIVKINDEKYKYIISTIENIINIYYDKKDKYIYDSIIDKEKNINSDIILFNEIKKNELLLSQTQNSIDKSTTNYTIYIVIIISISILIILFFIIK